MSWSSSNVSLLTKRLGRSVEPGTKVTLKAGDLAKIMQDARDEGVKAGKILGSPDPISKLADVFFNGRPA